MGACLLSCSILASSLCYWYYLVILRGQYYFSIRGHFQSSADTAHEKRILALKKYAKELEKQSEQK